jgi:putative membrane protein
MRSGQNEAVILRSRFVAALGAAAALSIVPSRVLGHGTDAPEPAFPAVLLEWRLDPLIVIGTLAAGGAYWWAVRRVAAGHPHNPPRRWRTALFMTGLAAILVALVSPIAAYEGSLFSVHMVQHMLLQVVAAPLLLLGAPVTLALRAASPSVRRVLLVILHSRVVAIISFPVVAWLLFAGVNWGWHFSAFYNEALENVWLHHFQHATFMAAALLFWWPVIAADPTRWRLPHPVRLLYLFLAMPQNSFLGVALYSASAPLYQHYVTNVRSWGPTPIDDQRLGGVIMWVVGDMILLVAMVVVVAAWMRHEDRRTKRMDAQLDARERLRSAAGPSPD